MPVTPTYPGVYVTEIASGVRTITGVATSITAFIGRAEMGPVDDPTIINSFADYERSFGGLWLQSMMSYAVKDFFSNGGSQAVIVRVFNGSDLTKSYTAELSLPTSLLSPLGDPLVLQAVTAGAWGNDISAIVDWNTGDPTKPPLSPVGSPTTFNLTLLVKKVKTEQYLNMSFDPTDPNYLPRVLDQSSDLLEVTKDLLGHWVLPGSVPVETPTNSPVAAAGGDDGADLTPNEYLGGITGELDKKGIYALNNTDLFNLLCIPPAIRNQDTDISVYSAALELCVERRAMLLVDPPHAWGANTQPANTALKNLSSLSLSGVNARNAALYFPLVKAADPLLKNLVDTFVPCGMVAGIMALTDTNRGVWKSPAGIDAALNGVQGLQTKLTDAENGQLNPIGINCLRTFPLYGNVVWGARTLRGADQLEDDYKYVAVRRMALFLEESLFRGTKWVVFEPNDAPLWAQIRLNIGAFMQNLFRQGAFQGSKPSDAYLVKCDSETTTQNDINNGIVNILVGFAPLKPAEFVILQIQQLTGQLDN
jgi:uncharacterized protein